MQSVRVRKELILGSIIILLLLFSGLYFYRKSQYTVYTKLSCGFAGLSCPNGYRCQGEGNSTGGWCVGNGWSPKLSEVTEIHLRDPKRVIPFNSLLKDRRRDFSFLYPAEFKLVDVDSGSIHLEKSGDNYILLEKSYPLNEFKEGNSEEEKFRKFYLSYNGKYGNEQLPEYKRISLSNNNFTYKIFLTEPANCGYIAVEQESPWSCYLAVIDGKGVSLANIKNVYELSIVELLNSIKFK